MVKRYYGGIMSANLITTSRTSASGFFGTHNQLQAKFSDNWPVSVGGPVSGFLWTWGRNAYGQLGDNTTISKSSPVQTIAGGSNWSQVSGGGYYQAAIKTDGTLWTWGRNASGNLGDNTRTHRSSPVQTIASGTNWAMVSAGFAHCAAIKTDGTLWTWGRNSYGNLGDFTLTTHRSSPVQTIAGGTNWAMVSAGENHTAAIKRDGTLWTWGRNYQGVLGNNNTFNQSSPVQTIAGGTNWKQVSCGPDLTSAVKTDGSLWTWGDNTSGQLGDNTVIAKSSPVQTISNGTNWSSVFAGGQFAVAIKTDGTLWTWGLNTSGQLGDNSTIHRSSPVQTIAGGTNWSQASPRYNHTAAIKTDGTLWTWGRNNYGNLGDSTTINKLSPVQTVSGGTNWVSVSAGSDNTLAIKAIVL